MPSSDGFKNLIPAAASKSNKIRRTNTYIHMKFVVWAMQKNIDDITVRAIKDAMRVSSTTAQNLRSAWRELCATRFYHDSVPDIVSVQQYIFNLPTKAANDETY